MENYIGTILPWAGDYAPEGWALCQGQTMTIKGNELIFSLIGTKYGGDGETYFKLPNLCGRFPIGSGINQNNGQIYNLGNYFDNKSQIALTKDNIPSHNHTITNEVSVEGNNTATANMDIKIPVNTDTSAPLTDSPSNNSILSVGRTNMGQTTNIFTTNPPTVDAYLKPFTAQSNITIPLPKVNVASTSEVIGASQPFDIVPSYVCVNYIICLVGFYPAKPQSANLTGLTLSNSAGTELVLTPGFDPSTYSYTLNTPYDMPTTIDNYSLVINPKADTSATIKINGTVVRSGQSFTMPLSVGSNNICIKVTTTADPVGRVYNIAVTRASSPYLLSVTNIPFEVGTSFNKTNYGLYTGTTSASSIFIKLTPEKSDEIVKVTFNGINKSYTYGMPISLILLSGVNALTVMVTSAVGNDSRVYDFNIIRL